MMKQLSQRLFGPLTLIAMGATLALGLWVIPPDQVQGELGRLVYIHPSVAWVALYVSFGTSAIASALYLWTVSYTHLTLPTNREV